MTTTATYLKPASDKQRAYLTSLILRKQGITASLPQNLSSRDASAQIDRLYALPEMARPAVADTTPVQQNNRIVEPGMYRTKDGQIVKVQKARGADHLYGKRFVQIGGQRLTETDHVVNWEFEYAPGIMREITPADKMTLEDAVQFGIRYGVCCNCGRHLKDATSVAEGIGPVCSKRFG